MDIIQKGIIRTTFEFHLLRDLEFLKGSLGFIFELFFKSLTDIHIDSVPLGTFAQVCHGYYLKGDY